DPVFSVTTTASAPSDPEPEPDPCQQSDAGCAPTSTVAYTPPPPAISDGGGVPVSKSYETGVIPCSESASQVIGSIEGNFAAFGNFQTQALRGLLNESVAFSPPAGPLHVGESIAIGIAVTSRFLPSYHLSTSVNVAAMSSTAFTFSTVPGHL